MTADEAYALKLPAAVRWHPEGEPAAVDGYLVEASRADRSFRFVERLDAWGPVYLVHPERLELAGPPAEDHPPCTCDVFRVGCTCGAMERERQATSGA